MRQLVRQLVYTMFISNNRAFFHLRLKENLVNHQFEHLNLYVYILFKVIYTTDILMYSVKYTNYKV